MPLNKFVTYIIITFFAIILFSFLKLLIKAKRFRTKCINELGFSEGIMTGISFQLLIIIFTLICIQVLSFILINTSSEFTLYIRLLIFSSSILLYFIIKSQTPPLLAYWFEREAFWENNNENGKISFNDVYALKISKSIKLPIKNNLQLCPISFYVKNKFSFFRPKKYSCKLTAEELTVLTSIIKAHKHTYKPVHPYKKSSSLFFFIPIIAFLAILSLTFPIASSGLFNENTYLCDTEVDSLQHTFTEISKIEIDENIKVYYDHIGLKNIYDLNGEFLRGETYKSSFFSNNEKLQFFDNNTYEISNNDIKITYNDSEIKLNDKLIYSKPLYYRIFSYDITFLITSTFCILFFLLIYFYNEKPEKIKAPNTHSTVKAK